jgi:hypothetical protein
MNELHRALHDIGTIRKQVARTTEFRGYGPVTLAITGVLAGIAAAVQARIVPDLAGYLTVWVATAVLGAAFTGAQVYLRSRRLHSGMSDEMLRMAVEQFLPAIAAGLLLTVVLVGCAPAACWMLPGLWQIVFSLGVFSSCRFLPREMLAAGIWYLASGLLCVSLGDGRALAPAAMGIPFGVGQMLVAAILLHAQRGETR